MWVKICGITNLEDARVAVDAGADAVGFVFYEKSPRKVDAETAQAIIDELPEHVEKVGVFVAGSNPDSIDIVLRTRLTAVQHYFGQTLESSPQRGVVGIDWASRPLKLFCAISLGSCPEDDNAVRALAAAFAGLKRDLPGGDRIPEGVFDTYFLDSGNGQQPGGTGRTFSWHKAVPIAEGMRQGGLKLVVAGGLTPENVGDAIDILNPWGVDVSSGVEARPGKKDPDKVRAFVQAARQAGKKE